MRPCYAALRAATSRYEPLRAAPRSSLRQRRQRDHHWPMRLWRRCSRMRKGMPAMTHPDAPLVHVVILNWNGWRDTVACVASVKHSQYPRLQIVVVDNDSSDGSEAAIQLAHPDITVLQSGANLGYAGGNNVGIRHALAAGADFVWILNNDTTVAPDTLAELVRAAADPSVGIVGSKIYYMAEPQRLWYAGGRIDWRRGISYNVGADQVDQGQFDGSTDS